MKTKKKQCSFCCKTPLKQIASKRPDSGRERK